VKNKVSIWLLKKTWRSADREGITQGKSWRAEGGGGKNSAHTVPSRKKWSDARAVNHKKPHDKDRRLRMGEVLTTGKHVKRLGKESRGGCNTLLDQRECAGDQGPKVKKPAMYQGKNKKKNGGERGRTVVEISTGRR